LHIDFKNKIINHPVCAEVRCKGTILAIELKSIEQRHYLNNLSENISSYFLEKGILLRPLGNVFYLIPPYCITKTELEYIYKEILVFLNNFKL
jgi:adenosylmethionine-8-amino-7-oxononanoate aminotransferase